MVEVSRAQLLSDLTLQNNTHEIVNSKLTHSERLMIGLSHLFYDGTNDVEYRGGKPRVGDKSRIVRRQHFLICQYLGQCSIAVKGHHDHVTLIKDSI